MADPIWWRTGMAAVLAAAMLPPAAAAQDRQGPLLLKLPASTRALALGNAFPVGSTDSDVMFYNAAYSDRLRGASAAVQLYGNASVLAASAGTAWWNGGLGVGVRSLDYGGGDGGAFRTGETSLTAAGSLGSERAATLTYGRRVLGVRLGASAHLVQHRTADEANTLFAADVAAAFVVGRISTGIAVRNIGPSYELGGTDVDMPLLVDLSASAASRQVGPLDLVPAASLRWEVHGDIVGGAGVELGYWPIQGRTFLLRLGGRYGEDGARPVTAGAGFVGDRIIIDYAIVPYEGGDVSHRFGVRWQ